MLTKTRKAQILVLFMALMLFAVNASFAQVSIDTQAITDAFQEGINLIFDNMIVFLPIAGIVAGLVFGLPLAFSLMNWIGKKLQGIFGGSGM